jgi:large subunit ribosomal protein L3
MSMGILGRKIGMTQIFDEEGKAVPVTVVEAGPCPVLAVRTQEKNGYTAVVLAFGAKKAKRVQKPMKVVFEKAGIEPKRWIREFRIDDVTPFQPGMDVTATIFEAGESVDVTGVSKGKGTAGGMKRYGWGGGPASHGQSKWHRRPGSSGAHSYPGRVFKGHGNPGRMGNERVTVKNLKVAAIDAENNLILIRGAIPGARNGLVMVRKKH